MSVDISIGWMAVVTFDLAIVCEHDAVSQTEWGEAKKQQTMLRVSYNILPHVEVDMHDMLLSKMKTMSDL